MLSRARSRARSSPASATVAQDAPEGERGHGGWPDYREALLIGDILGLVFTMLDMLAVFAYCEGPGLERSRPEAEPETFMKLLGQSGR